jgi:hypothetical protein
MVEYPLFENLIADWHSAGGVYHDQIQVGRAENAEYQRWQGGSGPDVEYWEWKLNPVEEEHHLRVIGTGLDGAVIEWPPDERQALNPPLRMQRG